MNRNELFDFVTREKERLAIQKQEIQIQRDSFNSSDLLNNNKENLSIITDFDENDPHNFTSTPKNIHNSSMYVDRISSPYSRDAGAKNNSTISPLEKIKKLTAQDMEQSITDDFYTSFPSFNEEQRKRKILMHDRQKDYQNHLLKIGNNNTLASEEKLNRIERFNRDKDQVLLNPTDLNRKNLNLLSPNGSTTKNYNNNSDDSMLSVGSNGSTIRINSPRHKLLEDLKHTELPTSLHSDDIKGHNQRIAEEESRKKMEYQKELIKQIEEKKREMELFKAKEKREEELLTKKLEEQLKTMELEEELEKQKIRSEKARIHNEQNHIYRLHLLSKLDNDHKIYNPYGDRKAQSENGKDLLVKKDDQQLYRYFSNSARYPDEKNNSNSNRYNYHNEAIENEFSPISGRYQYCKRCRADINESFCNFCNEQTRRCEKCNGHLYGANEKRSGICAQCRKSEKFCSFGSDDYCAGCNMQYCKQCRNRKGNTFEASNMFEVTNAVSNSAQKDASDLIGTTLTLTKSNTEPLPSPTTYRVIEMDDDDGSEHDLTLDPIIVRSHTTPYSLNVDKKSIFHPSQKVTSPKLKINFHNGEISVQHAEDLDFLRKKSSEKLDKYVQNYGELRQKNRKNPEPFPLLRTNNLQNDRNIGKATVDKKSSAVQLLENKWEIPAVQRNLISEKPSRVLTQLGAFRKHMQLNNLGLDE